MTRPFRSVLYPNLPLLTLSVVLPLALFGLAAWQGHRTTLQDATTRAERTSRMLQEHADKVFETQRLVVTAVNQRLRTIDWADERQRRSLHDLLERLQVELPQVATISVVDRDGRLEASSRAYPVEGGSAVGFADRDWFSAVRDEPAAGPWRTFVSHVYRGRQSGQAVFNVAGRTTDGDPGTFSGVVAVSVDVRYFKDFYDTVEPSVDHSVMLVRDDGTILARDKDVTALAMDADSPFMVASRTADQGGFRARSHLDGVDRIVSFRKVGEYPVYVVFGISVDGALAPWRDDLWTYGLVAAFGSLALGLVSWMALLRARGESLATDRWRVAAEGLRREAELRQGAEEQLRQSQKMEAVGRLTGGVAHDFNNVLTIVLGSLDMLRRRLRDAEPRVIRHVDDAIEGATRAAALTERLLAFSRRQPLDARVLSPAAVLAELVGLVGRSLGERWSVSVDVTTTRDVKADGNQLESALLNLAVNARDAMPDGGRVTLAATDVEVGDSDPNGLPPGRYVAFAVADHGTGMDAETLSRAFDPFFTTKEIGKGTGLGLSQVYGFARQSGGTACIGSEVGHGTTVSILLPAARAEPLPVAPTPVAVPTPGGGRAASGTGSVLVVEDEHDVRGLAVGALREAGHEVHEAADARGALEVLRREPGLALMFTDVALGTGMGGRELADMAVAIVPGLTVVFTTGLPRDAILAGGEVIQKPYAPSTLVVRLGAVLGAVPAT